MTNKTTKNKGGRPRDAVKQQLAEDLDVLPRRLRQLVARYGLDKITDIKELAVMEKRALIALRTVRGEREQQALEIERRELITHQEAFESGVKMAAIFNRMASEAMTNWPTHLAGKDELGVRQALQRSFNEFTVELQAEVQKI
jgi:hypothetical protein